MDLNMDLSSAIRHKALGSPRYFREIKNEIGFVLGHVVVVFLYRSVADIF